VRVDDGRSHQVSLAVDGVHCSVAVDGRDRQYVIPASTSPSSTESSAANRLDLVGSLYLGGLSTASNAIVSSSHHDRHYEATVTATDHGAFPVEMWTPVWRRGYVGCIRDLAINSERVDVMMLGRDQDVFGLVDHCRRSVPVGVGGVTMATSVSTCASSPCYHNGRCYDGWNRYVCDCSATGYRGHDCRQREFKTLHILTQT